MNEVLRQVPVKEVLREAVSAIQRIVHADGMTDWSAVEAILIDLPQRLEGSPDVSTIPAVNLETFRVWSKAILRHLPEDRARYGEGFASLYEMGSRIGDKNELEKIYDDLYPQG